MFILAFIITCIINYGFYLLLRRKNKKKRLTKEQQEHLRKVTLQLKFLTKSKSLNLFKTAFIKLYPDAQTIKLTTKKVNIITDDKNINFFPMFSQEITIADVINCLKYTNKDSMCYIASENFSPAVVAFALTLEKPVKLLDARVVLEKLLAPTETYPDITVELKTKKRLTWEYIKTATFARTKIKTYIILGLIILATSFIVRFNIYYIIIATLLFSFALISLFAPYYKDEFL